MRAFLLAFSLLFAAAPAMASVTIVHHSPGYTVQHVVHVDPWSPAWRPAPRAGYYWVDGQWLADGSWAPGYWQPVSMRAGYNWVPGYWTGTHYLDGFWRPVSRAGYVWNGGYYHGGNWVTGGWTTASTRTVSYHTAHRSHYNERYVTTQSASHRGGHARSAPSHRSSPAASAPQRPRTPSGHRR